MNPLDVPRSPNHMANRWRAWEMSPHNATVRYVPETGIVQATPERRKVVIYGAGLGKEEAPLDDPSWLVWGLNAVPPLDSLGRLRADAWWDIHQREAQNRDDLQWIAECPFPLYVPDDLLDGGPNTVRYPLAGLEALFNVAYWSCTFAYQIAMAIHMGVSHIGLFGVELAYGTNRERTVEWACVAYWLGRAHGQGIRIVTPHRTTLLRHPARYGFEYKQELDAVMDYTDAMDNLDVQRRLLKSAVGMGG